MTAGNNIFFSAAFKSGKFEFSNECTYMVALISKLEKISITQCLINLNYPMDMVNRRKTNFYEQTLDCRNINKYKSKYNKYLNAKTKIENLPVKKLYSKIKNKTLSTMQFSVIVDTIYNSFKEDDIVCYQTTWKLIFGMLEQSNEKIKKAIENIHPSNYDTELKKIINDFTLEKLLSCLNVETIHDLCMLDLNLISILFDRNLESLVNSLQQLSMSKEDIYNNLVEELEQKLKIKEIDYDVLSKRYGFFGEIQTLEEIAQQYGLTRERIRQIEKRAERMVLAFEQSIYLYFNTLLREMLDNNKYIEEFQLKQLYNQKLIGFTKLFATLYRGEIEYSYKYKIFYEKGSLEYIVEEILSNFPMLLTTSAYNEKNEFEKRVIDEFYSVRKNGKHMRIGFTDGIIYSSIVDELFPNGFSATEENMKKVNNQLVEKYEMEPVTAHALSATLSRMDYCYIDKG